VKYLIDANIWLEGITQGPRFEEVSRLIATSSDGILATTDFIINTIAIVTTPRDPELFRKFLDDLIRRRVNTLHLAPAELYGALHLMKSIQLDFDDAFQYFAAEKFDLKIVSFDSDFDRTPRGRITPGEIVNTA
jgi:predicted nucleic acid-binding protein